MNCQEALDNLMDLIYGELDVRAARELQEHLSTCASCQQELQKLTQARLAMAQYRAGEPAMKKPITVDEQKAHGLHKKLSVGSDAGARAVTKQTARRPLVIRIAAMSLAAAALVAAFALVWSVLHTPETIQTPTGGGPLALAPANKADIKPADNTTKAIRAVAGSGQAFTMISPPGVAMAFAAPPTQIGRESVSLTVLSEPANRGGFGEPDMQRLAPQGPVPTRGWQGLALVRDQRLARQLAKGTNTVALSDIPAGIIPQSVHIRPLKDAAGFSVLEQNYQFDLASSSSLLKKYLDQSITLTLADGSKITGTLLSYQVPLPIRPSDGGWGQAPGGNEQWTPIGVVQNSSGFADIDDPQPWPGPGVIRQWARGDIVLSVEGRPRTIAYETIASIGLAKLPEGLLVKPTLVWKLQNNADQAQEFEVAYLTAGVSWRADYVLNVTVGAAADAAKQALPEILDVADMIGYASVTNRSGVTFKDAQLKLLAGDVNLVRPEDRRAAWGMMNDLDKKEEKGKLGFQEQSFFEYHLYTLQQATTIRDNETKQIQMVAGRGMKMKRAYVYDPVSYTQREYIPTAPRVVSELVNSKANGLGVPLPKGVIRLYAPDTDGVNTYVAQTIIDHTPVNEKLRLPWGYAFDIACQWVTISLTKDRGDTTAAMMYTLHNAKTYDVTITAVAHVPATTSEFKTEGGYKWHQRQVGWIEMDVLVKAGQMVDLKFTYRYNNDKGGGLTTEEQEDLKARTEAKAIREQVHHE